MANVLNTYPRSYLIEQMPPTALWSNLHFVIPLANLHLGYAIKVVAASECVVNFYCNNHNNSNATLKIGESVLKQFLNNETCVIQSFSKILVMQFSLTSENKHYYGGPMMTLIPSTNHYF